MDFKYNNYFTRTGLKLFRKAAVRSLDIPSLVTSNFSKKTLAKHSWRIYSDLEFRESDADRFCLMLRYGFKWGFQTFHEL